MNYKIREITDNPLKKTIARKILEALPEYFGLEDSLNEYVETSEHLPFWAAYDNLEPIGFITLKNTSDSCGEIYCMGVLPHYHNQNIGTQLFHTLEQLAKETFQYLQVKTVDEGHYDTYNKTIKFYQHLGFVKLEVFPTLWDEWNPCLVMIKHLKSTL